MTGSGLMYSGPSLSNVYGQQPWAKEARTNILNKAYMFALTRGGTRSLGSLSEEDVGFALEYATSLLPKGATFVGGATNQYLSAGYNLPSSIGGSKMVSTHKWR